MRAVPYLRLWVDYEFGVDTNSCGYQWVVRLQDELTLWGFLLALWAMGGRVMECGSSSPEIQIN